MHDRAARLTGPVKSAAAMVIETMILLNIDLRIAQVRPRVEESVQRLPAFTCVPAPARDWDYDYDCEDDMPYVARSLQRVFGQSRKLSGLRPIC